MNSVHNFAELLEFEKEFLGKKSELAKISRDLKNFPPTEKKEIGKQFGKLRQDLSDFISAQKAALEKEELAKKLATEWLVVTKEIPRK